MSTFSFFFSQARLIASRCRSPGPIYNIERGENTIHPTSLSMTFSKDDRQKYFQVHTGNPGLY